MPQTLCRMIRYATLTTSTFLLSSGMGDESCFHVVPVEIYHRALALPNIFVL